MDLFLDFLGNFKAREVLQMYASGAFRTSDEIRAADFAISCRIVFEGEGVSTEHMRVYEHLQQVVDALRAHRAAVATQPSGGSGAAEKVCRYRSQEGLEFEYFVRHEEEEMEVERVNIVRRDVTFSFKRKGEDVSMFDWLKGALTELLDYVLRDFEESDRVGIVIERDSNRTKKAVFPIRPKSHLEASIIIDTLNSIVRMKGSVVAEEKLNLQALRIRIPVNYRRFTHQDMVRCMEGC